MGGCYKNSDQGERKGGWCFPERVRREESGVWGAAREGTQPGTNPVIADMPSSPWRTALLHMAGTASACTLWWPRSQLRSAARLACRQARGSWRLFRLFTWGTLSQREWGASGPASAEAARGELSQGGGCAGAAALRSADLSLHSPVNSVPSSVRHREDEQERNSPLISGLL